MVDGLPAAAMQPDGRVDVLGDRVRGDQPEPTEGSVCDRPSRGGDLVAVGDHEPPVRLHTEIEPELAASRRRLVGGHHQAVDSVQPLYVARTGVVSSWLPSERCTVRTTSDPDWASVATSVDSVRQATE